MSPSRNKTTSISASSVLDLAYTVRRIHNTASAILHRPENGDANTHYQFIRATAHKLDQFVSTLSDGSLTCVTPRRGVLVDVPNELIRDMQTFGFHLRAVTAEESSKVDLGHLDAEDRPIVRALHQHLNPERLENDRQLRRETPNESTGWQEQIDTIIHMAQARPEPIKRLEALADLAAEIIDTAAACLDYGRNPKSSFSLRARACKQSIFDECRRKPYTVSPKFIERCVEHIEQMKSLAKLGIEHIKVEQGEARANASNLHVAVERCQQFSDILGELTMSKKIG